MLFLHHKSSFDSKVRTICTFCNAQTTNMNLTNIALFWPKVVIFRRIFGHLRLNIKEEYPIRKVSTGTFSFVLRRCFLFTYVKKCFMRTKKTYHTVPYRLKLSGVDIRLNRAWLYPNVFKNVLAFRIKSLLNVFLEPKTFILFKTNRLKSSSFLFFGR